jgi:DNA-binding CsgD family transcriptional regulator
LVERANKKQVIITGPAIKPHRASLEAGYVCTTIRLKPTVFLKGFSTYELRHDPLVFTADSQARFWFKGICFQFPGFNQVELLISDLFKWGCLDRGDLDKDRQTSGDRTHSRHVQRITGLSPYQLYQLQRMHTALRLLRQGMSAADVAMELGFADQSHLTHASRQFLGHTPNQFAELPQDP